uniref:Uncharacterized protein n=1 Tax=Parascaris equorum TaxID=6256 RepID=A0A914RWM2_PAREQ
MGRNRDVSDRILKIRRSAEGCGGRDLKTASDPFAISMYAFDIFKYYVFREVIFNSDLLLIVSSASCLAEAMLKSTDGFVVSAFFREHVLFIMRDLRIPGEF